MKIEEAQKLVDDWIKKYGVKYFSPLTNLGILMEETGELSRHIVRLYGEQSYRKQNDGSEITNELAMEKLKDEMSDVLWVLICLANQTNIDLTDALKNNILKKTIRDKDRHLDNEKLKE